ncbi:DUF6436 domain-containing protein [Paraglaciecola sp. 20A4]|uniref:DUF6436 domain-containing protein n=1 Tax=Paraglaciecola sp. 20A4 TaxID=2687288 RepID=UPI00140A5B05|nr:DUF6436 domain-containing protein [Paraglaciecola sp. 20A4]
MQSSSFKGVLVAIGLTGWVGLTIGGLAYLSMQSQRDFDPQQTFASAAMASEYSQDIVVSMSKQYPALTKTVFHIQQEGCSCNFSNNIHADRIDYKLDKFTYQSRHVSASSLPADIILPSLPAIMVFDKQGELAYFGPYSSGYFCSTSSAIVDRFLDNILLNTHLGSAVVSEGYGCYCPNNISE